MSSQQRSFQASRSSFKTRQYHAPDTAICIPDTPCNSRDKCMNAVSLRASVGTFRSKHVQNEEDTFLPAFIGGPAVAEKRNRIG